MRRIGALGKAQCSVVRIGFEHNTRTLLPFFEPVRSRTHRSRSDVALRRIDNVAGNRERGDKITLNERIVRLVQPKSQRVAIEGAQSFDCRVIIELHSRLTSGIDYGSRTHDRIGDQRIAAEAERRIQESLERIDIVVRNQFSRLAAKRRVISKKNSGLYPDSPRLAGIGDVRKRDGRVREQLRGAGEIIPFVEALEDGPLDGLE